MEIEDYPNYLIYPDGRVFNKRFSRYLRSVSRPDGYSTVVLSNKGEKKTHYVHRLIAGHFLENTVNKPVVDHINGNTTDTELGNLRWVTKKENSTNRKLSSDNTSGHTGIRVVELKNGHLSYRAMWTECGKRKTRSFNTLPAAIDYRHEQLIRLGLGDYLRK